jgi:uncharacterized damage-inducible protein DinB
MSTWQAYLDDMRFSFRKQKESTEKAFNQVSDENFFQKPGAESNSIAAILKHIAGNLASRWTDFLTTDGEKPWRDRDGEFLIGPDDTRQKLVAAWDAAFATVDSSLAALGEQDLLRKVRIRNEELSVFQATHRSLTHTSYHCGQIVYLSRLLTKEGWKWTTIPPGQSKQFGSGNYLK